MTEAPKKRPWYRPHWFTAAVLVLVAGGMLWLNLTVTKNTGDGVFAYQIGWPFAFKKRPAALFDLENLSPTPLSPGAMCCWSEPPPPPSLGEFLFKPSASFWNTFTMGAFVADLLVAAAILRGVVLVCEDLIRRRERRP